MCDTCDMKCPGIRSSVFVYFLLIFFTEFISKSTQKKLSWFEAQKECMDNNNTLKSKIFRTSTTDYWSGIYLRYSSRIHILGCYSADKSVLGVNKTFNMKFPSVGFCQEICGNENILKFGIQAGKCTCIENKVFTKMLPPSECNETCAEYTQGVKFTECGGRRAYSVYMVENYITTETYCTAVNCGPKKTFSISPDCSELHFALCTDKEKFTTQETVSGRNWTQSMQFCKTSQPSSYLEGNVSSVDASKACKELNWTLDEFFWLGIITEVYYGNDRGINKFFVYL
ncbi:uncharacterized protein LOC134233230 [Saccostrea cucullata]|uniref:uncharacterized protein LOC134233230 n=1 Tax=Saccostrea cuccullata TaxID=36930 RepID=UPI002ED10DC4